MSRWGLKFAMVEHRWERRTNYVLLIGITVGLGLYYYDLKYVFFDFPINSSTSSLFFLCLAGFVHLIARLGHSGEQIAFKSQRPWRK